jgi:hypothetical protein
LRRQFFHDEHDTDGADHDRRRPAHGDVNHDNPDDQNLPVTAR